MTMNDTPGLHPKASTGFPLRIEHLWPLFVLMVIGMFIAMVPTSPNDFWWHLKVGQIIAEQGLPQTNMFAWTVPADHPYIYAAWLGEWLLFQLYQYGGFTAIVIARNLMGLLFFAFVAIEAQQRTNSWRWAALAALIAAAMTMNNLIIRTQIWSWVPFGLYMVILGAYTRQRIGSWALIILPVVMCFWVNAHGGFVLGIALVGIYTFGETWRRLLRRSQALSWTQLWLLYGTLVAVVAATLVNPLGWGIFAYVNTLLTDPPSQSLINEWQPPTTASLAGFVFYVSILFLIVAFAIARRRPTVTDLLLVCVFLWQAWNGQRYVVWYGIVAMPIVVQSLVTIQAYTTTKRLHVPLRSAVPNVILALLLVGVLISVQPPFKIHWPWPAEYRALFADMPEAPLTFGRTTPVAAGEYLQGNVPEGRLFNEMGYGSYLNWALYPDVQVFIDPRVELYPLELWEDYIAITQARNYNELLIEKYDVGWVMLDQDLQPALDTALTQDSEHWVEQYRDDYTAIYVRR